MPNQFLSPEGDLENYFVSESWIVDRWVGDTLWTWGNNDYGQLGINNISDTCTPVTTFSGGANWKQVACGYNHTGAIKTDGTLWTWGRNNRAQLGVNDTTNRSTPVQTLNGGTNWKQVACGYTHTAAIKTDGTLWIWGRNDFGQLGVNNITTPVCTPVQEFNSATNWKQVACGYYQTAAIKTDGTLWTWGRNNNGQLGTGDFTQRNTPVQVSGGGTNWKQVSSSGFYITAIKTDGTLWGWGINNTAQLGTNDISTRNTPVQVFGSSTNWKQVAGGFSHTAAIKTDGTLWTWGGNSYGQLGINLDPTNNRCTPVQTFIGGTNWKQVACGSYITSAIKTDGTLWIWGRNGEGQLGVNDAGTTHRCTPVQTFIGGTNWKQVSCSNGYFSHAAAVTSGTNSTHFIS